MFVLDSSVALSWALPDERSERADALIGRMRREHAHVPMVFCLEVVNGVIRAERIGRLRGAEAAEAVDLLRDLQVITYPATLAYAAQAAWAARYYNLLVYDATYLLLALALNLPLATFDVELRRAAELAGVELL